MNLGKFDPQIGFCHNDLSHANLIYNEEEGERERESATLSITFRCYFSDTVTPIDFEYGGPNFLIFDIANHFCEFGGTVQGRHT